MIKSDEINIPKELENTSKTYRNMLAVFGDPISVQKSIFSKLDEGVVTKTLNQEPTERAQAALPQLQPLLRELLNDNLKNIAPDNKDYKELAHNIVNSGLSLDKVSEALPKQFNDFYYDLINEYAKTNQDTKYSLVEIDISNMGNANIALGRENVDRATSIIKNIYENTLANNDNVNKPSNVTITPIRNGGDEIRFFVAGLTEEEVQSRLKTADEKTSNFTTTLGTDSLEHGKYTKEKVKKNPDDKNRFVSQEEYELRAGFNAGSGVKLLGTKDSVETVQDSLDNQIDKSKLEYGAKKLAIRQQNNNAQPIEAQTLANQIDTNQVDKVLSENEKLYSIKENQELPKSLKTPVPDIIIPTVKDGDLGAYDDFYDATYNKIDNLTTRKGFSNEQSNLLKGLTSSFINTIDPVTNLKSPHAFFEALPRKVQGDDEPNIMVEIEMTNVQGLNKKFNHEFANLVIRKTSDILKEELSSELLTHNESTENELYSAGGGRFRLLTHGKSFDDIKSAINKAGKRISKEIDSKTPTEIAKEVGIEVEYKESDEEERKDERPLHSLQHPKRNGEMGVSLLFSAMELDKKNTIKKLEEYKDKPSNVGYYINSSEELTEAFARKIEYIEKADFGEKNNNKQNWIVGNTKSENGVLAASNQQYYLPINMQELIGHQLRPISTDISEESNTPINNIITQGGVLGGTTRLPPINAKIY